MRSVTITYGISGGGYDAVTLTAQSVTVDDDETAGVTSSQSGALALTEGGSAGTYTLVLDTEPTGTVTITLTSSDTGAVTVTPTLSFDATDWSSTKTVTVTVVDDADATDEDVTITYGISGGGYDSVTLTAQSVTVDDDETAGVTSSQSGALALTEGGSAGTYTLVLATEPTGTVTITLTSSDTGAVTVTPMITFDATDWSSTKTVTVTVVDDADATDESVTITYGISGGGYDGVTLTAQSVTVDDDETAGVTSSQSGALALTEGGSAGTYTLVLATEPTGTVTITLTSSDTGAVTVTPTLSFDATDWSSTKTVTVTVVDDADATDEDVTITYGISGGGYDSVTLTAQSVTVDDDETAGVTSSQSGALSLTEGGSAGTYTLVLDTEPTGTVTITLTSSDTDAVTVTPTLSFDATDWNTMKTVTVTAEDDADATDEDVTITYGISGGGYDAVTLTAQSVTVDDDETAGVTSSQSGALSLTEGGSAGTYTLVLATEPTGTVTITLTSSDTGAVTVTPTLSFDASDWNTMKTVTVTAEDDADATDESVTITYGISGGGYDSVTLTAQSVTVDDDETAGVTSSQSGALALTEGGSAGTYTLVLDTEPTGTVTITLTSSDTDAVTVTPTLSFDATDWNTMKTVTVTAEDDADATDEDVTITYGISGGGYGAVTLTAQSVTVDDDETAGVTSSQSGALALTEGGSAGTYTLVLATEPTGTVTITLTSSDTGAVTVTPTLSFDATDWSSTKTVTVTVVDDDDATDEDVTITYGISGGGYGAVTLVAQSVTVDDDETAGVTSSQSGALALTEGGSAGTYTLVLATEPTGTVTITLTSSDTGAVTVTPTLSFDASDWNTMKTVTVTAEDDADATDESVTITYGISGGGYDSVTLTAQSVTVDDDETAGVTSSQSGALALTEGGSAGTYTLVLDTEPTGTVTITLTSSDTDAVTVTPTLSFDATDWNTMKTVTVTAEDDADATDEDVTITYGISGGGYGAVTLTAQSVTVDDDETAGVTSSQSGALSLTEGGSAGTYTLVLATEPTGTVTITLTSSDTDAVTVTPTLSFDATDWNTMKTVTVTAEDDADATDEDVTITYGISGGGYDAVTLTAQSVTVDDDETAGVTSSQSGALSLTEGGSAGTYTLVLATEPTGTVTITLTSSDTGAVTVTSQLMFTTSNWDTAQTVTVTAVDDVDATDETVSITYVVTSTDTDYNGFSLTAQSVTVDDDETAGVTSSQSGALALTEGGSAGTYTLVLDTEPTGTVTITLTSSDTDAVTVTPTLSFDATDWNTMKTVTVTAEDDADATDEDVTITYGISGGGYGAVTLTAQSVTVDDDETAGVTSSQSGALSLTEGGSAGTYTLVLATEPTGTVTITLTSSDTDAVTVTPTLSFDATDWNTMKTVTVTAEDDADATDEDVTITYGISGGGYDAVTLTAQSVTVDDDETAGVTSSQSGALSLTEGGSAGTYTLVLDTQPTGTVTITLTSSDTGAVTVNSPLTFDATDWNTAKTVTLTGEEDGDIAGESVTISYGISGGDYDSVTLEAQSVTVTDNDSVGITSSTGGASISVDEGDTVEYTLVLTSEPTATVTVVLRSDDAEAVKLKLDGSVADPAAELSIEFTASTWNTVQTVVVSGEEDDNATGESVTISYGISGGDYDSVTLEAQSVTVTDNDSVGITSSTGGASISVDEGDTVEYTLVLTSEPTATVTVVLRSDDAEAVKLKLDGSVADPAAELSIEFTASTWDTVQTVVVSGEEDDNATGESVSISYGISGGDYDSVTLEAQSVAVTDNDSVGITSSTGGASISVDEGDTVEYTLVLTSEPTDTVTVVLRSDDAEAVKLKLDGSVADPAAELSIEFTASTWNAAQTVVVSGEEDDDTIAGSATISYTITGGDYAGFPLADQSVSVNDDDMATLALSSASAMISEAATEGSVTMTLELSGGIFIEELEVSLSAAGSGANSAEVGVDGTASSSLGTADVALAVSVVTILARENSAEFTVNLNDDDIAEGDETFEITLSVVSPPAGLEVTSPAQVSITDDDAAAVRVVADNNSVTEGTAPDTEAGVITLTLTLDNPPATGTVTVTAARDDASTALLTDDYTLSAASVILSAGDRSKTIEVTMEPDDLIEGDEVLVLSYSVVVADSLVSVSAPGNTELTITDDDFYIARIYVGAEGTDVGMRRQTGTITEAPGSETTTVIVALDDPAPDTDGDGFGVIVHLKVGGTATVATDYTATNPNASSAGNVFTIGILPNRTEAVINMTAVNDDVTDAYDNGDVAGPDETVIFTARTGTGYKPATDATGSVTVTIEDNNPDPVTSFTARRGVGNVRLNWVYPDDTSVVASRISIFVGGRKVQDLTQAPIGRTFAHLSGLDNGTEYTFSIVTVDGNGNISSPVIARGTPGDDTRPGPVTGFTATTDGQDTGNVLLSWTNPSDSDLASVIISAYAGVSAYAGGVTVDIDSSIGGPNLTLAATSSMSDSHLITGLSGTEHRFSIVAIDESGNRSDPVEARATPEDDTSPEPVTGFTATTGSGDISLSWMNPSDLDIASVRISAVVTGDTTAVDINGAAEGNNLVLPATPSTPGSSVITGLDGTAYTFTIVAIDMAGNESSSVTARAIRPLPVASFTAHEGDSSVFLDWGYPSDPSVVGVRISATSGGVVVDLNGSTRSGTDVGVSRLLNFEIIQGLTNGTEYTFSIVTADGSGNISTPVTVDATPRDPDPPGAVTGFTATAGSGNISLSWMNPSDLDLASVEISATSGGVAVDINGDDTEGNDLVLSATPSMSDSRVITGLDGTEYRFTIVAIDISGNRSAPVTARTARHPDPVPRFTATARNRGASLSWGYPSDPSAVAVRISATAGGEAVDINPGDVSSYDVTVERPQTFQFNFRIIQGLTNGTEYTFSIVTVDGSDNTSTPVEARATPEVNPPPGPVTGFTAIAGSDNISLSWMNPSDSDLASVRISATSGGVIVDINGAAAGNNLELPATPSTPGNHDITELNIITGLNNGAEYSFRIEAVDTSGKRSIRVTAHTARPDPVTGFNAVAYDNTVTLFYNYPVDPRAVGVRISATAAGVAVDISPGDDSSDDVTVGRRSGSRLLAAYTIRELTNDTEYSFSIVTVDSAGNISTPDTVSGTPHDILPGPVTDLTATAGSGNVSLSWMNPFDFDLASVRISATSGDVAVDINGADTDGNDLVLPATRAMSDSHVITGLDGTEYIFTIVTIDMAGTPSVPTTVSVTRPDPVTSFTATLPLATSVSLAWDYPVDPSAVAVRISAVVTGDTTAVDINGHIVGNDLTVLRGQSSIRVQGLTSGTTYTFSIVTVDSSGNVSNPVTVPVTTIAI